MISTTSHINPMANSLTPWTSTWQRMLLKLSIIALTVSGFGQMPIFKRYYIADLPGMAWTADFYFLHKLHYVAAAVLMCILLSWAGAYAIGLRRTYALTTSGLIRIGLYAVIIGTGVMRVMKNYPDFYWAPTQAMLIDIGHLAAVMFLGAAALGALVMKSKAYLTPRDNA